MSFTMKENEARTRPAARRGAKTRFKEIPEASMTRISLSELRRPTAMSAPTSDAKGKESATNCGIA